MVERRTKEVEVRKKGKKLDWIIYLLALISLVLMVVVIVTNSKTDVKVVDVKPIISDITEKEQKTVTEEKIEPRVIEPIEKEKDITKTEDKESKIIKDMKGVKKEVATKEPSKKSEVKKEEKKVAEERIAKKEVKTIAKKDGKYIDYNNYNWKALKRYKAKPDKNLYVVSEYTVKSGDALWKIAQKFGVRTINIIAVNSSLNNPDIILPGQIILIPNM